MLETEQTKHSRSKEPNSRGGGAGPPIQKITRSEAVKMSYVLTGNAPLVNSLVSHTANITGYSIE